MNTDNLDTSIILEFLEDIKNRIERNKNDGINVAQIDGLLKQLQANASINDLQVQQLDRITYELNSVANEVKRPIIKEHHFSFNIESKGTFILCTSLFIISIVLGIILCFSDETNTKQENNDLKYRYIKMKGGASPAIIEALETTFEIKRDQTVIDQIRNDVVEYEKLVQKQAEALEQAHLNASKAHKLHQKTESIKNK